MIEELQGLAASYARRSPLNLVLLKVAEVCNINCTYCFMFNLRDKAHQKKPAKMDLEVVRALAPQLARVASTQGLKKLFISFHGGEPLVIGRAWISDAIKTLKEALEPEVQLAFGLQTNGILLNRDWLDFCREHSIGVGLSMDGLPESHDKYRVDHRGRGTYDRVVKGLQNLIEASDVGGGTLVVIDPAVDGADVYRHLRMLGVKQMDFLWPLDHNWEFPPERSVDRPTPFADYMISAFDAWWAEHDGTVRIRYFDAIILHLLGGKQGLDAIGGNSVSIVSIDTDGGIEPLDSLKACGDGFTNLDLNVLRDPIERVYTKQLFQEAIAGEDGLCDACRACPFSDTCGGGYLPHRFRKSNRFDNPSVYCADLFKLISHIAKRVEATFDASPVAAREPAAQSEVMDVA